MSACTASTADWFVEPRAYFQRFDTLLVQTGSSQNQALLQVVRAGAGIDGGLLFGNWAEARLGVDLGGVNPLEGSINIGVPPGWNNDTALHAAFTVDTADSRLFPTSGSYATAQVTRHLSALGGRLSRREIYVNGITAMHWGDIALVLGGRLGSTSSAITDFIGSYQLGGFLNLSGLGRNSLIGQQVVLGRAIVFYRLGQRSPIGDVPLYVGGSFEAGNVYQQFSDISFGSLRTAGSAFIAADTPLGPLFFAYGRSSGSNALYLALGRVF